MFGSDDDYSSRVEALRQRVAEAAEELNARGMRPTVTRIRAALGGGSPNDLAPALKSWKESFQPTSYSADRLPHPSQRLPAQIADLAHELWQRARIAAVVERKGGGAARALAMRTEEAESLKTQVTGLRDQLQHASIAFGELRAQAARHEAIARDALARLEASEARERKQLRELGSARERVAELEATVTQLNTRLAAVAAPRRRPSPRPTTAKMMRPRRKNASRARQSRVVRDMRARRQSPRPRALIAKSSLPIRRTPGPKKSRANPRGNRHPPR
jgi:DNA repair exonuclease SbcCD ATPase subunit